MILSRYKDIPTAGTVVKKKSSNPMIFLIRGYLILIVLGTILLKCPFSLKQELSFVDAFFTATSAVCVTGLSVIDIGNVLSYTGLWILAALIQVGGLGIMTFSTAILLFSGIRPGFNQQALFKSGFTSQEDIEPKKILIAILPFTLELSRLSAREFMEQVLRRELGVEVLILGYDHAFGHGGGSLDDYVRWGRETGIEVVRAHELSSLMVSSSKCRRLIEEGDVRGASEMLGRFYTLSGEVVRGFHVGHELGFPTANLQVDAEKVMPRNGAYAVWATLADGERHGGMLNIGTRPTIGNGETTSVEVNLLDYDGNLYDQRLTVEFVARLRDERRFDSRSELMSQLALDEAAARELHRV